MWLLAVVEGRRNRKPSQKIRDLLSSRGQRPVSAIVAAAAGPEVVAVSRPEVAAARPEAVAVSRAEVAAARPEVVPAKPEVAPDVVSAVSRGDRRKIKAKNTRSSVDDGITEEPLYKSVQVNYLIFRIFVLLRAVFRIRIRPDPKLFGLKNPDPALDPDPSLFHTKLINMFEKCIKK